MLEVTPDGDIGPARAKPAPNSPQRSPWITDRVPDSDRTVLVSYTFGDRAEVALAYHDGERWTWWDDGGNVLDVTPVLGWTDLPSPLPVPKEATP